MKRIPILPSLVVLIACAIMVRLGFWQLDRLHQKETMLARFEAELAAPSGLLDLNRDRLADYPDGYERVRVVCNSVGADSLKSGRNASGQAGWAHVFPCTYDVKPGRSGVVRIVAGWTRDPRPVIWTGGAASGLVVPESMTERWKWHIVADPPLAGLQPNARPDPRDLPNNHLAYAVQWFAFAGVALVIYGLAVRKRRRH